MSIAYHRILQDAFMFLFLVRQGDGPNTTMMNSSSEYGRALAKRYSASCLPLHLTNWRGVSATSLRVAIGHLAPTYKPDGSTGSKILQVLDVVKLLPFISWRVLRPRFGTSGRYDNRRSQLIDIGDRSESWI